MKRLLIVLLFIPLISVSQIPDGYYDAAIGLTGEELKLALHNIIKGHTEYPYSSSSTDTWDILKEADKDPSNPNNVIGIYSAFSMNAALEYDNGDGWNREHIWAKSRGDFGTSKGAGTDLHHLRAADISTNSARSNRNFDNADKQYNDASGSYNGATDSYTSDTEFIWQPRAEMKGDVARMIFYMATRYEGDAGEPDLELTESLLDNSDKSPLHGRLSTLLEWHLADPVSDEERSRNYIIYSYQNNRNPFIDHPEYVCMIYTCEGENNVPVFTSDPVLEATESELYAYDITTSDVDGDNMTITAPLLPSWLTLTPDGNGESNLSGTPTSEDKGSNDVELHVSDGATGSIQAFIIEVSVITSHEFENPMSISIYPNPTTGVIKLNGRVDTTVLHLEVVNTNGQSVYSTQLKVRNNKVKDRLDLSDLEAGIYTIKITGKSGYEIARKISLTR